MGGVGTTRKRTLLGKRKQKYWIFLKVDQWFQRDESLINELKIGIFRLVKCKRSKCH